MSLRLQNVSKVVNGETHIEPTNIELEKGTMNVLLGPTLSGKTSLMRIMAGLDKPDAGHIFWNGSEVTGHRVQSRDVAMVYQQFVNYPSLSVYENIASPLRLQRKSPSEIDAKVMEMARLLKLTDLLDRKPSEISGGQQQRCAIARALAKDVGLVLMDEPLANLDYKLREELRIEIPRLFAASGSIFVYATTEPEEALLLGGNTATLWEGRVTQFGPSMDVYHQPADEIAARVYSDPPMNFLDVQKEAETIRFPDCQSAALQVDQTTMPDGDYRAGFRAHQVQLGEGAAGDLTFAAKVSAKELTGSETFLHLNVQGARWISLAHGLQSFAEGTSLKVSLNPKGIFYFGKDGKLAHAPRGTSRVAGA
ncbi:MAG: ABC transporter ATP-binding protein [Pseudomonadota bacterium]